MDEIETCPAGAECPVHHKNDGQVIDHESEYACLITYVGDKVVYTTDNGDPFIQLLTVKLTGVIMPRFATEVLHVGEGALFDAFEEENMLTACVFRQEHDSWPNIEDAHDMIVDGVRNGTLELKG